jgi:DNA-binding protein HU-beta
LALLLLEDRAARTSRNLKTGATIQIKAFRVAAFKAGKALKAAAN